VCVCVCVCVRVLQETNELLDDILTVVTSQQRDTMMTLLDCGLIELVKLIWSSCLCQTLQDDYVPHHLASSLWVTHITYCLRVFECLGFTVDIRHVARHVCSQINAQRGTKHIL